jgi:hypothetical protein
MAFFGRGKNKVVSPYTIQHMYKAYMETIEDGSPYDVPYSVYKDIVTAYFKRLSEVILDECISVKLPCRLGTFQIIKKPRKYGDQLFAKSSIDWAATVKYGEHVHHDNSHTDGYRYLFMWNKANGVRNIRPYRFIPTRANKRKLAYYLKNKIKDYFEVK